METYKHPNASFRLTTPIQLGSVPPVGKTVQVQATGELTLRGVTEPVTFPLSAERVTGGIDVNAEIPIVFSRWHIPNPSFAVAQVGNTGTAEVLLHLISAAP
jgi:polyisoprenoid-binding protein YceI